MNNKSLDMIRADFENYLNQQVANYEAKASSLLSQAMFYSLMSGGKRIRPVLLLASLMSLDSSLVDKGYSTALALEYIHTYSLIHDDLPAMDNDDMRRGKPTNHIQFDEARAILAGDALLTDAFGLVVGDNDLNPDQKSELVAQLSYAAGSQGMVLGQTKDMLAEGQPITIDQLKTIHWLKTGQLFRFAVEAATIISETKNEIKAILMNYADAFGLAFQIQNDLRDLVASLVETGRNRFSDAVNNKATYPSIIGVEASIEAIEDSIEMMKQSVNQLNQVGEGDFSLLLEFIGYLKIESLLTKLK